MAQTQYARYERGFNTIKIENLIKFALFFNTSLDYLCGITDTPYTLTDIDYFENRKMIIDNKKGKT